jgi:hypothetical protein
MTESQLEPRRFLARVGSAQLAHPSALDRPKSERPRRGNKPRSNPVSVGHTHRPSLFRL